MPRFWSKQRSLALLAVFAAGAVAGMILAPSAAITADDAAMAALEARVVALEELVTKHMGVAALTPPAQGGVVLKAPFTILDTSNRPVFSVAADGGGATVQVLGAAGQPVVTLDGPKRRIAVESPGQGRIEVGADAFNYWGLGIRGADGQLMANLSREKEMALRIYNAGTPVAQLGDSPGAGGLLRLYAGGQKVAVSLEGHNDGTGALRVAGKQGEATGVWFDGQKEQIRLKSDKGGAILGNDELGWGMTLTDGGGFKQAAINDNAGSGMGLRLYDRNIQVAGVTNVPGNGGVVRVYSASATTAGVGMEVNSDGSGLLKVHDSSGKKGIALDGQNQVAVIDGDAGTIELGKVEKGWGLGIRGPGGQPLADLSQPKGKGMALRVYEGGQQAAALGVLPGKGGQIQLYGKSALAIAAGADSGGGWLAVYKGSKPSAMIDGPSSTVAVHNGSGQAVSMLSLSQSGSGGKVQATDSGGVPVFKAGYEPDGPGSACVNHKGIKCLGIGLTGMEGFH